MAAPPFVISTSLPGDSDIVSQFPGVDRTLRDVVVSWLQVDHNNNPGGHVKLTMDQTADPAAVSGKTVVSSRTDGSIVKQNGLNTVEYVGAFPGAIMFGASPTVPAGWFAAEGQAVSRTTFATLFALIGTTFGPGDGTTTFNLPNIANRMIIGQGTNAFASTGGSTTHAISIAEMPSHDHGFFDPGHFHNGTMRSSGNTPAGGLTPGGNNLTGLASQNSDNATTGIVFGAQGSNVPMSVMNPFITLRAFIKY